MEKTLLKNERFRSIVFALVFVGIITFFLFSNLINQIPYRAFSGGLFFGLVMVLFPKQMYKVSLYFRTHSDEKYTKQIGFKYRLVGVSILILTVLIHLLVFKSLF